MSAKFYLIQTPEATFTFIGAVRPGPKVGVVYLCAPGGKPVMEARQEHVTESTAEEVARRIIADRKAERAKWN